MIYAPSPSLSSLDPHYRMVVKAIADGSIVPFLGDEINLCSRETKSKGYVEDWCIDDIPPQYPPTNVELALYLDIKSGCNFSQIIGHHLLSNQEREHLPRDGVIATGLIEKLVLQQVSQYIDLLGDYPDFLSGTLCKIFDTEYLPNSLHNFFASLPKLLRIKGHTHPYQLLVTTCFDSTLEHAFQEMGEPFDLVSFVNDRAGSRFVHQKFIREISSSGDVSIIEEGDPCAIDKPNEYENLSLDRCSIILKLYGGIRGLMGSEENFVITEDHCIDYLAHRDIGTLLPASLLNKLRNSNILFLGYRPSYWNLRVILHRLWPQELLTKLNKRWWAIQPGSEIIDQKFWEKYTGHEAINLILDSYIAELNKRMQDLPVKAGVNHRSNKELSGDPSVVIPVVQRDKIFISYSHQDDVWLEKLRIILKPLEREGYPLWDDRQIKPGAKWKEEIEKALASSKIAILLVSKNFINSDFISKEELPPLLEAAEKEGLTIFWIYIGACAYDGAGIDKYQAAHSLKEPLNCLDEPHQDVVFTEIFNKLRAQLKD
jgi:hypothetical protein